MRLRPLYSTFSSGELSPLMYGRVDTPQYATGVKTLSNFIPDRRGGVFSRPPALYVGEPKNNNLVRLVPFIIARDDAYIMEIGAGYIRFWQDGALVENGGSPFESSNPWTADEIFDLQFAQANDVMYIVSDTSRPRKLQRVTATSFDLTTPTFNGAVWNQVNDTDTAGYPRTVCFYQQRLVFGGRAADPQTIWMSRTADFEEFGTGATNPDDNPITLVIAAYTQELIQWLAPSRALFVGTTGNEQRILPNGALAPGNLPDISRQSSYGSRYIQPQYIGTQTIFVQATGTKLRNYDLNTRANVEIYDSLDLTFFSEHIGKKGFNQIAYQQIPDSILWAVTDDGDLVSMTYDPSLSQTGYEAIGWADHDIDGTVETMCVLPRPTMDEVWVVVNRGGDRYIGRLDGTNYYLDASVTKESGTEFTTVEGLDHLEGETVGVIVDGALHPDQVVPAGGILTLPTGGRFAQVGLRYTQTLETLPPVFQINDGTSMGRAKGWRELWIKVHETMNPLINGNRPPTRSPSTPMGNREPLFSGDLKGYTLGAALNETVTVEQDLPYNTYLLAVHGNLEIGSE